MYQPRVFCVKLQLHFGGDIHEISVPAYDGVEPTVADLMTIIERDFRVPRTLQNLVFHGQELHPHTDAVLSCFGIKNLATIRLVGRMAPPEKIQQLNSQYNPYTYQQPIAISKIHTTEQNLPYYYPQCNSIGTQYDPPELTSSNTDRPPSTANKEQINDRSSQIEEQKPATPNSSNTK
ncbi:hypothetical protein I4U23_006702 [Adineta vaga]|nr:hypothetical protein I4U23_006702 [Adineta vaga]